MSTPISLRILVVEDNDSLREATVDFLCAQGHDASGVVCAEEVDDTPMETLPDLYLIDVHLPGENGFSLAQRLRQAQPAVGIVLITARGQLNDRLEGYQRGADNYLAKPVEQAELLACIQTLAHRLKPMPATTASSMVLHRHSLHLQGPQGQAVLNQGEYLLLASLCRAAGNKLERWQAMQLLDPNEKGLVPANLEMRISALRKKLATCGAPEDAIRTLRGYGYALSYPVTIR